MNESEKYVASPVLALGTIRCEVTSSVQSHVHDQITSRLIEGTIGRLLTDGMEYILPRIEKYLFICACSI